MNRTRLLTVSSLLSVFLLTVHLTQDAIVKKDPTDGPAYLVLCVILALFTYGALQLAGRRSGYIISLLTSIGAAGMPVLHRRGLGGISGDFWFVWVLVALGITGLLTFVLSVRGLVGRDSME